MPPAPRPRDRVRGECAAKEAFDPFVMQPHPQPVSNQPRRHGKNTLRSMKPPLRVTVTTRLVVIRRTARRQGIELRPLDVDQPAAASVGPAHDLVDEPPIGREIHRSRRCHGAGAPAQSAVLRCPCDASIAPFSCATPRVVAGRLHAVMRAQRLVACGQVGGRVALEVAERRREAVAAMLGGRSAERPEGVLQPDSDGDVALAAEHDMSVLPAGEGQAEVVEPVREPRAADADAQPARVSEVGQALASRWMLLAEDHFALGAMQRLPEPDAALQRAAGVGRKAGMAALDLA